MRTSLLIVLAASAASAHGQVHDRNCDIVSRRSDRGGVACAPATVTPPALFEFAPSSGTGMGVACAGTTPTGAIGEALTFTRASSAYCNKTGTITGIANGDMATVTSNQPRVGTGGSGGLKLMVEEARTNVALHSNDLSNAAWLLAGLVSAPPTITANHATAPDGTTTATRAQIAACPTAGNYSVVYQTGFASGSRAASVYCKGTSVSQTISICVTGSAGGKCVPVTCPSTSWTRAISSSSLAATSTIVIGCDNEAGVTGAGDTGAADVLLWGGQQEAGTTATSLIATTTAAATRVAEVATFPITIPAGNTVSLAATYVTAEVLLTNRTPLQFYFDATNNTHVRVATASATSSFFIAGVASATTAGVMTASASNRLAGYYDGTNRAGCLNGTCVTAAASLTLPVGAATVYIGGRQAGAGFEANGFVGQVCIDPVASRCI